MDEVLYLRIRNWRTFQHYSKRNPPWIKLYHSILDDYDFTSLPEVTQAHAFKLYLLACRTENKLPFQPLWIAKRISAQSEVDLEELVRVGFLEGYNNYARGVLAKRSQPVSVSREETETETEKRRKEKREKKAAHPSVDRPGILVPIFCLIPTNKNGEFHGVTEAKVFEYQESYPAIDAPAQVRAARQWCIDNPAKRKTLGGMPAFLNRWLAKDQNRGAGRPPATPDFQATLGKHAGANRPLTEKEEKELAALRAKAVARKGKQ